MAWQCTAAEVTVKVFKKCCMYTSYAVDRTDYHMLWNGSIEDRDVRNECEEDEGTDCEAGDSDTDW